MAGHGRRQEALCRFQEYPVPYSAVLPSLGPCELHTSLVTHRGGGRHARIMQASVTSRLGSGHKRRLALGLALALAPWSRREGTRGGREDRQTDRPFPQSRAVASQHAVAAPACTSRMRWGSEGGYFWHRSAAPLLYQTTAQRKRHGEDTKLQKSKVKITLLRASCQRRVTLGSPGGRQGTKLKLGVSNMICELFALSTCLGLPGH